ncbi:MAG: hypothetical protein HQL49_10670 [Gammaproteobacteria bacterium]|nr:hypothetical protein [Gammaproteobacteria bacterium]
MLPDAAPPRREERALGRCLNQESGGWHHRLVQPTAATHSRSSHQSAWQNRLTYFGQILRRHRGGGGLNGVELIQGEALVPWGELLAGTLISAVSAYLCIFLFLRLLNRIGMTPFVIYRLLLALLLFVTFGF